MNNNNEKTYRIMPLHFTEGNHAEQSYDIFAEQQNQHYLAGNVTFFYNFEDNLLYVNFHVYNGNTKILTDCKPIGSFDGFVKIMDDYKKNPSYSDYHDEFENIKQQVSFFVQKQLEDTEPHYDSIMQQMANERTPYRLRLPRWLNHHEENMQIHSASFLQMYPELNISQSFKISYQKLPFYVKIEIRLQENEKMTEDFFACNEEEFNNLIGQLESFTEELSNPLFKNQLFTICNNIGGIAFPAPEKNRRFEMPNRIHLRTFAEPRIDLILENLCNVIIKLHPVSENDSTDSVRYFFEKLSILRNFFVEIKNIALQNRQEYKVLAQLKLLQGFLFAELSNLRNEMAFKLICNDNLRLPVLNAISAIAFPFSKEIKSVTDFHANVNLKVKEANKQAIERFGVCFPGQIEAYQQKIDAIPKPIIEDPLIAQAVI